MSENKLIFLEKYFFKIAIVIAFLLKLYFVFHNIWSFQMNSDEESNYNIALQHFQTGEYPKHAFHGTGTVYIYELTMHLGISKTQFILLFFILSNLLYLWSIYYFHKLSSLFLDQRFTKITTIIYAIYPSTIYFIGSNFVYENISTYILIYFSYMCIKIINKEHFKNYTILYLSILISISCYLRAHLIAFYLIMFISMWLIVLYKKNMQKEHFGINIVIKTSLFTMLFFTIFHYPILLKNEKLFGAKILSTQSGYELLQGHNPYAKGTWNEKYFYLKNDSFRIYCNNNIKNYSSLNEYQQSEIRKNLAIKWIKENPSKELKLTINKIKIFFSPVNLKIVNAFRYYFVYNPINIFIHIMFLISIFTIIIKKKINSELIIIFLPIIASLSISIIFFVGMRWRFYAEPFMILIAMIGLNNIFKLTSNHFNKKNYNLKTS